MLNVIYAQCHLCSVPFTSPFVLSVVMLNVVMLRVVMLSVVEPFRTGTNTPTYFVSAFMTKKKMFYEIFTRMALLAAMG
jgi:hypothetical protein